MKFVDSVSLDMRVPIGNDPNRTHPTALWVYPPQYIGSTSRTDNIATTSDGALNVIKTLVGDDRPVLFIHGFRGDHHGMELIAHYLRTRPVIVPDLPGFGDTAPLPGTQSLQGYVDFVDGLVHQLTDTCGIEPLVVGHSFGSIVTAHWAATHPSAPGLVLINPITVSPLEGPSKILTKLIEVYYKLGRDLPKGMGRSLLSNALVVRAMSQMMVTTKDPGLRGYIHSQHAMYFSNFADTASLAEAFAVSVQHTASEVASRLTMPVLVIAGNKDRIAPLQPTQEFISSLENASARVFDGVGHLVHYERPEDAAQEIDAFMDRLQHDEANPLTSQLPIVTQQ